MNIEAQNARRFRLPMRTPVLLWLTVFGLLFPAGLLRAATLPLRWYWANPTPHGNNIKDMAYDSTSSLAVQVCEKGRIYTSYDLDLWTPRDSGTSNALRAVTFFNGRIIVVGESGTVLYANSPDSFLKGTIPANSDWLEGVAAAPALNVVVAVGDNGAVYRSTDGITWTRRASTFTNSLRSVAFNGSRFVAVGESGYITSSPDGITWSQQVSPTSAHLNKVAAIGSAFYAVGAGGVVLTNSASLWRVANGVGATNDLYALAGEQAGPRLVVGDIELRLNLSGTWSAQLKPAYTQGAAAWTYYSALAFAGTTTSFLVGGRTGMLAEGYRTNGNYGWVESSYAVRNWLWDIQRVGNTYLVVGDNATIMSSADGVSWQVEVPPAVLTNTVLLGIGGTTNLLVAVGDAGTLITSTNSLSQVVTTNTAGTNVTYTTNWVSNLGLVWTAAASGSTNSLQGVAEHAGRLLVAGDGGEVLTCDDGIHWTRRATATNTTLSGAAGFAQGFVACGAKGTLMFSPDGAAWTLIPPATTNWIYRVRCLNGTLVAVGQNGLILTSTNGINWTTRSSGTTAWLNDVTLVGEDYFAAGVYGTVLLSTNAVNWTPVETITGKSLYGLASDGRQLIMAGIEGVILRSQVLPRTNSVDIAAYTVLKGTNSLQNLFLFGGKTDQRFSLESNNDLQATNWYTDATLEISASDGTLYYLQTITGTNVPANRYFRTRLVP